MKKRFVLVLALAACSVLPLAAQSQQPITTKIVNPSAVFQIGTALNHISEIHMPGTIIDASIGSAYVRMQYQGNVVLIEPLKAGISTNLFIWTANTRATFEILPASAKSKLTYDFNLIYPPPPPPAPGPTPAQAERDRDATYDPFLLSVQRLSQPHYHFWNQKPLIEVRLLNIAQDTHSYYLRVRVTNMSGTLYRVQNPEVFHVFPTFGVKMALRSIDHQLSDHDWRKVRSYDESALRTHGSTLTPRDLRPYQSAEWVIAFDKPKHSPAMYDFVFPSDRGVSVHAVAVF